VLVGLARRTALDHWYAENGDAYYRRAAERFLTDAAELVPAGPDGRKATPTGAANQFAYIIASASSEIQAGQRLAIPTQYAD